MAEYIDREEAKAWIANWLRNDKYWNPYSKGKNIPTAEVFDVLSRIPAADVQPVKHGKNLNEEWPSLFECSICHWSCWDTYCGDTDTYNYCPNCGARMDGGT